MFCEGLAASDFCTARALNSKRAADVSADAVACHCRQIQPKLNARGHGNLPRAASAAVALFVARNRRERPRFYNLLQLVVDSLCSAEMRVKSFSQGAQRQERPRPTDGLAIHHLHLQLPREILVNSALPRVPEAEIKLVKPVEQAGERLQEPSAHL